MNLIKRIVSSCPLARNVTNSWSSGTRSYGPVSVPPTSRSGEENSEFWWHRRLISASKSQTWSAVLQLRSYSFLLAASSPRISPKMSWAHLKLSFVKISVNNAFLLCSIVDSCHLLLLPPIKGYPFVSESLQILFV